MAILRRIREALSRVSVKKNSAPKKTKSFARQVRAADKPQEAILGTYETTIEQAKFSYPKAVYHPRPMPQELPGAYGRDRIVLQVRDSRWVHAYWEVTGETTARLKNELGRQFYGAKWALRAYDVTDIIFNGNNSHRFFDIHINDFNNNWYIDTNGPGRSWCVDLGLLLGDGRFITIIRSNTVHLPLDGPSWITDEEWMIPDDLFARLYGMGFGLGRSSPIGKAWQERIKQALFSGAVSSPTSPVKLPLGRKFWMVVDCELIVYGATEPDAKVTVQGKEIKLRPDGTFSLRFALPDGRQSIPVKAVSADGVEEHTITPVVSRQTQSNVIVKETKNA